MRKSVALASLVCGLVLAVAAPALATPVTWSFSGVISGVDDFLHRLDGSVAVGTAFSGTHTFESTMVDDQPGDPAVGLYTQPSPPSSQMVLDVGNYHIVGQSTSIRVRNFSKDDILLSSETFSVDPIGLRGLFIWCADLDGNVFSSDTLPLAPPPLEAFTLLSRLSIDGQEGVSFGGPLTTLTPEPLSLLLICIGALPLVSRRRSRPHHT